MSEQRVAKKAKPRGKPFAKNDPRRGRGGRKRDEHSITYWMQQFGAMTPVQVAAHCDLFARELRKGGDGLPIFAIIAVRTLMQLMNETEANLLGKVLDRTEGKPREVIEGGDNPIRIRIEYSDPDPASPASGAETDQSRREAV